MSTHFQPPRALAEVAALEGDAKRVAIEQLLDNGALDKDQTEDGVSCRMLLVEEQLRLGFPHALNVAPDDLQRLREYQSRPRFGWRAGWLQFTATLTGFCYLVNAFGAFAASGRFGALEIDPWRALTSFAGVGCAAAALAAPLLPRETLARRVLGGLVAALSALAVTQALSVHWAMAVPGALLGLACFRCVQALRRKAEPRENGVTYSPR